LTTGAACAGVLLTTGAACAGVLLTTGAACAGVLLTTGAACVAGCSVRWRALGRRRGLEAAVDLEGCQQTFSRAGAAGSSLTWQQ
jgi:hypothetical protein